MTDKLNDPVLIPHQILISAELFDAPDETLQGRVIAILRDSTGDQYCVFELADMGGLHVIHLGSNYFKGWASH